MCTSSGMIRVSPCPCSYNAPNVPPAVILHTAIHAVTAPIHSQIVMTTTDIHLPQRIGTALKRAYHGDLDVTYAKDQWSVRARWRRE